LPEAPKIQTPPAPPTGQEERSQEPPAEYEKLTGSKGDQWKQLHAIKTAAQLRVQELEAKLAARAQSEPPEEFVQKVKTLQQERDEYLSKLEAVAAERSPRFQAQFQPRIDSALQLAKGAVGPAQAQTVEQIFGMQDSEYRTQLINDVSSNLTDFQKGKFFNSIAEIDRVQGEKAVPHVQRLGGLEAVAGRGSTGPRPANRSSEADRRLSLRRRARRLESQ
jgi:hypothetical protein